MEDILNGYKLITPFQNKDAGFSRWTFALKNNKEYFIKEFLSPIFPIDDSLSEKIKMTMIQDCDDYQRLKIKLYDSINCWSDGNLVRVNDFFRYGSHYYIVTEKIYSEKLTMREIAAHNIKEKMMLCLGLAHSLMCLEKAHIIHADLKADNILLQKSRYGMLVGKIIDFDCSFFEELPPDNEEEMGCDQVYISPEAIMFIFGEKVKLTSKMDVFSLGILFHQYLTGDLPYFDIGNYSYVADAVLDDANIMISTQLPREMQILIKKMLEKDPVVRPTLTDVYAYLYQLIFGETYYKADESRNYENPHYQNQSRVVDTNIKTLNYFHKPDSMI